jgi:hypothetical protein
MPQCVLCLEEYDVLTDEHVIYAALGSNLVVPRSTCTECQSQCNRSFEQKFLKGSNFVSMLRAFLGIKGRRNIPIYGFDDHGEPLTIHVQPGFPPIRVGLTANGFERPIQIIVSDADRNCLEYFFLPDKIDLPITRSFFDEIVEKIPDKAQSVALWADGNFIAANHWRDLLETFVSWGNQHDLAALVSCISAATANVPFTLDWNRSYIKRAVGKIGFMYLILNLDEHERFSPCLDQFRSYLLKGVLPNGPSGPEEPVLQWNGTHPLNDVASNNEPFTYLLAVANIESACYAFVHLHNMGLFACRLTRNPDFPSLKSRAAIYLLNKEEGDSSFRLKVKPLPEEQGAFFAEAANRLEQ